MKHLTSLVLAGVLALSGCQKEVEIPKELEWYLRKDKGYKLVLEGDFSYQMSPYAKNKLLAVAIERAKNKSDIINELARLCNKVDVEGELTDIRRGISDEEVDNFLKHYKPNQN